ncbi:hypothetical protein DPMN_046364 [Dreissena polymorpha]|uniref:Uncharacterized protein n=1 Tax=Dreissena polymorpha TaxID=45954 RepID=A0A9D4D7Y2_DREPO|nr:hypothetical protein DPMN_046364 [Dreissena polymorpha]
MFGACRYVGKKRQDDALENKKLTCITCKGSILVERIQKEFESVIFSRRSFYM